MTLVDTSIVVSELLQCIGGALCLSDSNFTMSDVTRYSTPGFGEPRGVGEPGHFSTLKRRVFKLPNPGVFGVKNVRLVS